MRKIVVQIIFSVLCLSTQAQKVSNVHAEQRGQDIVVFYSLETNSPCEVKLFLSEDNGLTWGTGPCNEEALKDAYSLFVQTGYIHSIEKFKSLIVSNPQALKDSYELFVGSGYRKDYNQYKILLGVGDQQLLKVSGDVGENILAGEKRIIWNVLDEREHVIGDKIKFKVIADEKKTFEPEMVLVKGGTFQMGSESGESYEKPVHSVSLSSFYIGKYEVTQAQWQAVMGSNPSSFSGCDNCPVEKVSWNDAQQYIQKLNTQTGKNYRLPTEAEWEYASKGGKSSMGYTYSGSNDIGTVAWFSENSGNKTHDVGTKQANELGIYDMSGNVWEWCSDWYGNYSSYSATNPTGASSGQLRVLRGGSCYSIASICRSSFRNDYDPPGGRNYNRGFRLVLPVE